MSLKTFDVLLIVVEVFPVRPTVLATGALAQLVLSSGVVLRR